MSEVVIRNHALEKLQRDEVVVALVIKKVTSVDIALVAASCGYDALYVDLEHSVVSESDASQICITASLAGVTPLVRVPAGDIELATRMLDHGALGIVFPQVRNPEEAEALVRACRFTPDGERGVAGQWPHIGFKSYPAKQVRKAFNDSLFISCMLESPESIEHAAAIAAIDGVSVVHIGSQDMTDAMGIPGDFDNPMLLDAYKQVIAAARQHGKAMGTGRIGKKPELVKTAIELGARFVTVSNEWAFIMSGAEKCLREVRGDPA
jgi:2-keto-3-deoxy-L-rhamnonate aldolase RhmA